MEMVVKELGEPVRRCGPGCVVKILYKYTVHDASTARGVRDRVATALEGGSASVLFLRTQSEFRSEGEGVDRLNPQPLSVIQTRGYV